ncbi:hypothetical protein PWT90_06604 [Aphanocladium album]|nr:hypothetical protein PWT90_06604 [Aphanocladium album]
MIAISVGSLHCPLDLRELLLGGHIGDCCSDSYRTYYSEPFPQRYSDSGRPLPPRRNLPHMRRPDQFVSVVALHHLGFTADKAIEIWETLPDWKRAHRPWGKTAPAEAARVAYGLQRELLQAALAVIAPNRLVEGVLCASGDKDAITEYMSLWGLRPHMIRTIMAPRCNEFRSERLCSQWATDIIQARFDVLARIWRESLERELVLMEHIAGTFPNDEMHQKRWKELEDFVISIRFQGPQQQSANPLLDAF